MPNKKRNIGIYVAILVLLLFSAVYFLMGQPKSTMKYYQVVEYFEKGQVREYTLNLGNGDLEMKVEGENKSVTYKVPSVEHFLRDIEEPVKEYNEKNHSNKMVYDWTPAAEMPWWLSMLPTILLIGGMVVLWFFMMNQAGGGNGKAMSFGKVKVAKQDERSKKNFDDVAGADEEKEELAEIVEFLKDPGRFNELGAHIPKGVLLIGPPGTGKTLLAKAVAGEAGVPFFSISGSNFVEMFVGVGASRVRDLFEQAKKEAPSIVFIDEIDAVGRQRGAGLGGGHDEREQTLNQLLVEMDGFSANQGVIVMAATNRRDILDPALLRPGRFDREVYVGYPDIKGREEILKVHARGKPLGPDVELGVIAKTTSGFTGADLENLLNEAALLAARKRRKAITMEDIQDATIKVVAGPEKRSKVVTEEEKKLTSYHEAGHAIVTYYLPTQDPVHEISIIPRGMAGGYTMSLPTEDKNYKRKKEMNEEIVVLLGGRVAEKITLEDISTGASNDIQRATNLARAMVTQYGFSEKLGPIVYGGDQSEVFIGRDYGHTKSYSENVAAEIDAEIREVIETAFERAKDILTQHVDQLHTVAKALMEFEKLDGQQFKNLMEYKEMGEPVKDPLLGEGAHADREETHKADREENPWEQGRSGETI